MTTRPAGVGLLVQITSASVACGFHAGDPLMITATCRIARDRQVAAATSPRAPSSRAGSPVPSSPRPTPS